MDTQIWLLTILCGTLTAWIVANYIWKKPAAPKKPFVVRVSGIPPDASQAEACVKATVATLSNNRSDCISDITIVPSCTDTDNLVAIVGFKLLPDLLSSLKEGSLESIPVPGKTSYLLHFDAEFLGFTQMYPTEAKPTAE